MVGRVACVQTKQILRHYLYINYAVKVVILSVLDLFAISMHCQDA